MADGSRKVPFALPSLCRAIVPPWGSLVALVIPANSSALELTQIVWWSTACNTTGRSLTTSSSHLASKSPPSIMAASYAPPIIQGVEGFKSAKAFTWALISSMVLRPLIFGPAASRPANIGWACPSRKAGRTKAPLRSIVVSAVNSCVFSPIARIIESLTSKS